MSIIEPGIPVPEFTLSRLVAPAANPAELPGVNLVFDGLEASSP